jgi:hypothetical protein
MFTSFFSVYLLVDGYGRRYLQLARQPAESPGGNHDESCPATHLSVFGHLNTALWSDNYIYRFVGECRIISYSKVIKHQHLF